MVLLNLRITALCVLYNNASRQIIFEPCQKGMCFLLGKDYTF